MNLVIFFSDGFHTYNSSKWRASNLVDGINTHTSEHSAKLYGVTHWQQQTPVGVAACAWADVIVLQRMGIDNNVPRIKQWQAHGKVVILDYDDDYFRIRKDNTAYRFWGKGVNTRGEKITPHPIEQFKDNMLAASAVSTPSRLLCDDANTMGVKSALYVPNLLRTKDVSPRMPKPRRDRIWLGWGGSMSHVPSWKESGILSAITELLMDTSLDVGLRLFGDRRILQLFPTFIHNKINFSNYIQHDNWLGNLYETVDIGLAPLAGEYDCRRSHIKLVEYGVLGIPFVATHAVPYLTYQQDNLANGLFVDQGDPTRADCSNEGGWYNSVKWLIDHYNTEQQTAEQKRTVTANKYQMNRAWITDFFNMVSIVQ